MEGVLSSVININIFFINLIKLKMISFGDMLELHYFLDEVLRLGGLQLASLMMT